jgi:hypothetical protein
LAGFSFGRHGPFARRCFSDVTLLGRIRSPACIAMIAVMACSNRMLDQSNIASSKITTDSLQFL